MLSNLRMLETMSPWDFHSFRKVLADGAGTDSPGFHALMTISPLMWDDFKALLVHEQVTLTDIYIYADRYPLLMAFAEGLTDYDEVFQIFRTQHFKLAQRMIGPGSIGTGGTPMEILERTLRDMFYPESWEVRNQLTKIADERGLKGRLQIDRALCGGPTKGQFNLLLANVLEETSYSANALIELGKRVLLIRSMQVIVWQTKAHHHYRYSKNFMKQRCYGNRSTLANKDRLFSEYLLQR